MIPAQPASRRHFHCIFPAVPISVDGGAALPKVSVFRFFFFALRASVGKAVFTCVRFGELETGKKCNIAIRAHLAQIANDIFHGFDQKYSKYW